MPISYSFDEIFLDPNIFSDGSATGGPQFANTFARNPQTGIRKINVGRFDFQQVWDVQTELLTAAQLDYFLEFWAGGFGSAYGFRVWIPADFYVINEVIGTGTGSQTVFNLTRKYLRPGANHSYTRRIIKPVVNALLGGSSVTLYEADGVTQRVIPSTRATPFGVPAFRIRVNNSTVTNYTVDNAKGIVTFSSAPTSGYSIDWSGEYDTPMAFNTNSIQMKPKVGSDIQGIQLMEIMPAELNIT